MSTFLAVLSFLMSCLLYYLTVCVGTRLHERIYVCLRVKAALDWKLDWTVEQRKRIFRTVLKVCFLFFLFMCVCSVCECVCEYCRCEPHSGTGALQRQLIRNSGWALLTIPREYAKRGQQQQEWGRERERDEIIRMVNKRIRKKKQGHCINYLG